MNENRIRPLFPEDDIQFPDSYRSFRFPSSSVRPPAAEGVTYYNTSTKMIESFQNGEWIPFGISMVPVEARPADALNLIEAGSNVSIERTTSGAIRIHVPQIGDLTTAMNVGSGGGSLFQNKIGTNLFFRRLRSTNDHLLISTDDESVSFTMQDPGESNTIRNLGNGVAIGSGKHESELLLRTLIGSDSITITPDDVLIRFELGSNVIFRGDLGIGLPQADGSQFQTGRLRYNPTKDVLEAGLKDGWHTLGTVTGTFLPLAGGTLQGPLYGPRIGTLDLDLTEGTLTGPGMTIDLEGAKIASGLTGTIDGVRFPDMVEWWSSFKTAPAGLLVKTKAGFNTVSLSTVAEQLQLDGYKLGLAENLALPGLGSVLLPSGPTMTRGDLRPGAVRFNSLTAQFEGCHLQGWRSFVTYEEARVKELVVEGDIFISGMMNHRNFGEDLERFAELEKIRGIPSRSDTGWSTVAIVADVKRPGIHVSDLGEEIAIGIDAAMLVGPILEQVDQNIIRAGSIVAGRTIDGRNLALDGMVIDQLKGLDAGILTSEGEGQFGSRSITASALPANAGLSVDNPLGEGEIRLGLRLADLPTISKIVGTDRIVVTTDNGNATISFTDLVIAIKAAL